MDGFSILDRRAWDSATLSSQPEYVAGNALGWLSRSHKQASTQHALAGRLYVAKSGWLLLSVPNALVRGVYDAMTAPGAELPLAGALNVPNVASDVLNAHISVMTAEEVKKIGADNINERGHMVGYSLGHLKEITPRNVDGVSKLWALQVSAPMLSAIRKSYGLSPLVNGHPFHITVAVRRKKVLQENNVSKAAAAEETTYDCNCSGKCTCPPTCTCKRYCCATKQAADLTKLAPKWGERDHLLAALPQHLTDTQTAIQTQGNVDKEMTDLALIAQAWLKSQRQKELLAARLKRFQETAAYPSLAAAKAASAENPQPRVRVVLPYKNQYLLEKLTNPRWPENLGKRRFIGGGVEEGETPEQAAARELFEELGVKIKPTAFRALGPDYREGQGHVQYLELPKHKLKPGVFNATVGSDAQITLEHGMPAGPDYYGPDIKKLLAPALKKAATQVSDKLPGGEADGVPDSKFPRPVLAEGAKHEHEHTDDDQIAKEIAKDHLSEDPHYYEKQKEVEKGAEHSGLLRELHQAKEHSDAKRYAHKHDILRRLMAQSPQDWEVDDDKPKYKGITHKPTRFRFHTDPVTIPDSVRPALSREKAAAPRNSSVYAQQLYNMYNLRRPLRYDFNKSFLDNVHDTARDVKSQGDFRLQADRNYQRFLAARDPNYRYQLAVKAMNNELEEPAMVDQVINRYGDSFLNTAFGVPK